MMKRSLKQRLTHAAAIMHAQDDNPPVFATPPSTPNAPEPPNQNPHQQGEARCRQSNADLGEDIVPKPLGVRALQAAYNRR